MLVESPTAMSHLALPCRIAVAGPAAATAAVARQIVRRGLGRAVLIGAVPGEGASLAREIQDGTAERDGPPPTGGKDLGDVEGCAVVILSDASAWGRVDIEAAASCVARRAPEAIVIVGGARSNPAARSFLKASRLDPRQVIAAGGLTAQMAHEAAVASRLGVSSSQVSVLVIGDEGSRVRAVARCTVVAGIPAAILTAAVSSGSVMVPASSGGDVAGFDHEPGHGAPARLPAGDAMSPRAFASAAALIADSILRDRRRILSCGVTVESSYGLPTAFVTVPAVIGAGGCEALFPAPLSLEERAFLQRAAAEIEEMGTGPPVVIEVPPRRDGSAEPPAPLASRSSSTRSRQGIE